MENIILNAAGISKTYHAGSVDVEALKKSDVLFKKGEFTAIVGKLKRISKITVYADSFGGQISDLCNRILYET